MLKFTPQQQIAENTIIDQIILETALNDQTISVNKFKGAVVVDPNLGNYVVIDFTVTDAAAMHIGRIRLKSGQNDVAISEDTRLLIVKEANKNLKIRLAAQFAGAENCKFNTTSVNLPYATPFREGVVRFNNGDEINKSGTVYSAADVDAKIDAVTESLGNLKDYAKINAENTFAENNTFTKNVIVNGEISGDAVATTATANEKDALVVSVGFANNKYLSKTEASATYLTQENATATYLKKTDAEQAAENYAKLNADNDFAANTTNTFNGDVTVKGTFVVGDSQETATFTVTADGTITGTAIQNDKVTDSNSNKLPTEGAVKTYVDDNVTTLNGNITALQTKDNDLQSQIDGINAGQNLADIVDTTETLAAYDVSHLKAKYDYQHGSSGAKWEIGDKVQVLGDANVQSSVYELIKGTKPTGEGSKDIQSTDNAAYYWSYIGVYGTNAYTKSEIDATVNTINTNIGKKADKTYVDGELAKKANSADVYSKTAADDRFAVKNGNNTFTGNNTFNGTISGTAVTSDIATDAVNNGERLTTCAGVSSFVNTVVDNKITALQGGMSYLKLTSTEKQTVASSVDFNGTIGGTAVAEVAHSTEAGRKLVTVDYANEKLAQLASNNNFTGATNTFQAITATTVSAQTFTGDGVTASQMNDDDITQNPGKIVSLAFAENRYVKQDTISDKTKIGAMGLFLYTGGDFKEMGTEVHGSLLHAVGMQLPMDGVVSWSQGTAVSTAEAETTWKLLNNTIAGEPCLVLAIRVG